MTRTETDGGGDDRLGKCDEEYAEAAGDLAGPLFASIKANSDKISLT